MERAFVEPLQLAPSGGVSLTFGQRVRYETRRAQEWREPAKGMEGVDNTSGKLKHFDLLES